MAGLLMVVAGILGLISLVCLIMVIVKMFQNGETNMGIISIVLIFVCGIGVIFTFVYGWIKSGEWGIQQIMLAWTGCVVGNIILQIVAALMMS